jgi:CHAD domain-containing protein
MWLGKEKLEKPLRKLRKLLKNTSKNPTPDEVHDLRTRSRRLEAILHALSLDEKRDAQCLLRAVAPIRKQAGKVRDMDVLTGFAATLAQNDKTPCVVQLLEHLGTERTRFARKLRATVRRKQKKARRGLKRYSSVIQRKMKGAKNCAASTWQHHALADALELSAELAAWPRLATNNLHAYRLEVKQLSYVLQLAEDPSEHFLKMLNGTKDAIGEWHDWSVLADIAAKVLEDTCSVRKKIDGLAKKKLGHALVLSERMRAALRKNAKAKHSADKRRSWSN